MDLIRYEEPLCVDEISLKWERFLGQGSYGFGSLMVNRFTNQFYAKKTSLTKYKENLKKELRIMLHFRNHPRIVQAASASLYIGMLLKDCYIYMEYASEGTLDKIISSFNGKPIPENVIGRTTRMILQGLEALHSDGYVHCDLKASNVFLFPSTSLGEFWEVKIGEFGLSKEPNTDPGLFFGGTKKYMPPEGFDKGKKREIGPAFDIWSLGCLVFEMFGGKAIKGDLCYFWKLDQDISPVAIDFLRQCHKSRPSDRASATMLLNHAFIKQRVSTIQRLIPTSQHYNLNPCPLFTQKIRTGPLPTPIGPPKKQQELKRKVNNVLHDWDIDVTEEVWSIFRGPTVVVETPEATRTTEAADLEERGKESDH